MAAELNCITFPGENATNTRPQYCGCDGLYECNVFKYFAANFNKLGLKKLTSVG